MLRRSVLTTGAAIGAFGAVRAASADPTFGNPDQPPQGATNTQAQPRGLVDPGPRSQAIAGQFPDAFSPPATDVADMPSFWASFNNAPRRVQAGGWARQVTHADFNIAEAISGVNMRLEKGAIREMHWHLAAEWAIVTYGTCRVTALDPQGRSFIGDIGAGDLWYFPAGYPHSLQGVGDDGAEFVLCFDDGKATEFNTLLLTDWLAHTPPDVLAENFGVPVEILDKIPLHDLYIFPSQVFGSIDQERATAAAPGGSVPNPFIHQFGSGPKAKQSAGGFIQVADSTNFRASATIAAALVTVHPGAMREMHWHPNADEWQYYLSGSAKMTVFNAGPKAVTDDFKAGDIGYVKRSNGHYIKNTGSTDLVFIEVFKSDHYADISLNDWLASTPSPMVSAHLNVSSTDIKRFTKGSPGVVPA